MNLPKGHTTRDHVQAVERALTATEQAAIELISERDQQISDLKLALRLITEGGPEDPVVIAKKALGIWDGPAELKNDLDQFGFASQDEVMDEVMRRG